MNNTKNTGKIPPLTLRNDEICVADQEKCEVFADQFKSVFTIDNGIFPLCPQIVPENSFVSFGISSHDVVNAIRDLNGNGSPGLDNINPIFIKTLSCYLITPLKMMFKKSIDTGMYQRTGVRL